MFHWYGFFIGVAVVVGYSVAEKIEPRVSKLAPWVLGLGLIGARMWHVIELWSYYSLNLGQVAVVWKGGLSIWGGIIGGGVGFLIGERRDRPAQAGESGERWKLLGAIATAMPLAQAIGRVGNAVNGEFVQRVWLLRWWSAEAILDLILFGVLWRMDRSRARGQVKAMVYLVGYGLIRLVLQPYRL